MCGIVGLYTKNPALEQNLGAMLSSMLIQMTERGPDSAGFAVYHNPVGDRASKVTLQGEDGIDWGPIRAGIQQNLDANAGFTAVSNHAVVTVNKSGETVAGWIEENLPEVNVTSVRTQIMRGKVKRYGRGYGKRPNWKKAIVTLQEGQSIEFFEAS